MGANVRSVNHRAGSLGGQQSTNAKGPPERRAFC